MANSLSPQDRFRTLQAKARETQQAARDLARDLDYRYQDKAYAPRGKQAQLATRQRQASIAFDRFMALLDSIQGRNFSQGVPCSFLIDGLTYADAITLGQLAVIPPPAWNYRPEDMRQFAWPVSQSL